MIDWLGLGIVGAIIVVAAYVSGFRDGRTEGRRERLDGPPYRTGGPVPTTLDAKLQAIERENGWR